jgi:serine phosphatase RsbU (regulator of sigma subunit)
MNEIQPSVRYFGDCDASIRIIPAGASERAGDWCETFSVSDEVVAFSIGDVSGHGDLVHETAEMLRECIMRAAHSGADPSHALARANRSLLKFDPETMARAVLALFNKGERSLLLANAGHPPFGSSSGHRES